MPQRSFLAYVLDALGVYGLGIMGLGVSLMLWGLLNLVAVRHRYRKLLILHAALSFAPLLLGLVGVCVGYAQYLNVIAASAAAPQPSELAGAVSFAMLTSIVGTLMTIVCAGMSWLALALYTASPPPTNDP